MTTILKTIEVRKGQYAVYFECDSCAKSSYERKSHFDRKKRHFCSRDCYSSFRANSLPKEEQHAYKNGGLPKDEKIKRVKARSDVNHAIRDGKLKREGCEICGSSESEAHHDNYNFPLDVRWLCFSHHREWHKKNPELPEVKS